MISILSWSWDISGWCWVRNHNRVDSDHTMIHCIRYSLAFFPSGRRYGTIFCILTSCKRIANWCAYRIGAGIRSGVSSVANPNIIHWSHAPPVSTHCAISGDCVWVRSVTLQVCPSKYSSGLSYHILTITSLAIWTWSTIAVDVISPAIINLISRYQSIHMPLSQMDLDLDMHQELRQRFDHRFYLDVRRLQIRQ